MDKEAVMYIYSGILLSHKNGIYNNMDGRRGHYAKSHKERRITIFYHLYIDSNTENKWINKAKWKEIHRHRGNTGGCQSREGVDMGKIGE